LLFFNEKGSVIVIKKANKIGQLEERISDEHFIIVLRNYVVYNQQLKMNKSILNMEYMKKNNAKLRGVSNNYFNLIILLA